MIQSNRWISYLYWRFVLKNPRFKRFLTQVFYSDSDVDIQLFGASLRINKRHENGYWNAYRKTQEAVMLRNETPPLLSLALILEPTDTFVDIGANVGLYSASLSKLLSVYPSMKYYAFEANPKTVPRLRQSLKGRPVTIFGHALSDHRGKLEFVGGFSSLVFGAKQKMLGSFQIQDTSEFIDAQRLDETPIDGNSIVLKIDAEGHEAEVLQGAQAYFDQERIKAVYLDGYSSKEIPQNLKKRGFKLFNGQSLQPEHNSGDISYSLLAIHERFIKRFELSNP
jgi:FkbM family methyltransferase